MNIFFKNFILFLLLFSLTFCTNKSDKSNHQHKIEEILTVDTVAIENNNQTLEIVKEITEIDSSHTGFAYLISGINQSFFKKSIVDSSFWMNYTKKVNKSFSKIKNERLDKMTEWLNNETNGSSQDTTMLFYPFSGADFLHAYHFFPNANEYLLLAKESIGAIPELNSMDKKEIKKYLDGVDFALRDIYRRSYFITRNMRSDIKENQIEGLMPLFYWFIARTEHNIIDCYNVFINDNGNKVVADSTVHLKRKSIKGVEFKIVKPESEQVKTLTYFDCDISNDGFERNPEFKKFLNSKRASNTFVKSASYLMHYSSFSEIRKIVLNSSSFIIEDDTGIPFKYFEDKNWTKRLHGVYEKPIRDFSSNRFQEELEEAYKNDQYYVGDIPFSLGYHWGSENQNQMTMKKIDTVGKSHVDTIHLEDNMDETEQTIEDDNVKYYIIVSSFQSISNAENLRQQLIRNHPSAQIISPEESDWHRVSIMTVEGRSNMLTELANVKKDYRDAYPIKDGSE